MDGVGPDVVPVDRGDPGAVRPAPQGHRAAGPRPAPAARPGAEDAAVRRRQPVRRAAVVDAGRHGGLQPGVDVGRRPCRGSERADRARWLGASGCTASGRPPPPEPAVRTRSPREYGVAGPGPPRARCVRAAAAAPRSGCGRCGARRPAGRRARRLQRGSGLGRAGRRDRLRGARARRAGRRWSPSTTGCSPARPSGPPRSADLLRAGSAWTRCWSCRSRWAPTAARRRAARTARYAALDARRARGAPAPGSLLGHTLDDQAETVLLGLGRGSGPALGRRHGRPGSTAVLAGGRCSASAGRRPGRPAPPQGLPVWDDPRNADPAYTRVRLRAEVLPLLEDVLGGGVAAALARTAALLREDLDALDALAAADGRCRSRRRLPADARRAAGRAAPPGAARWLLRRRGARPAGGPPGRRRRAADPVARAGPGRPTRRRGRRPGVWQAGPAAARPARGRAARRAADPRGALSRDCDLAGQARGALGPDHGYGAGHRPRAARPRSRSRPRSASWPTRSPPTTPAGRCCSSASSRAR